MRIGDIFLRALVDDKGFEADLVKKAGAAGDKAGMTLGQRMGKMLTRENVFAGIGAATGVLAMGALKLGEAYDDAFDNIRVGTGATGEAFEGLKKDFTNLIGSVPDDVGVASQVLADLNTRTGQTGDGLVALSKQILDFSRITKTDAVANVRQATRLFGDWSIATEDQAGALDKVFRASQATGISVDELMTTVVDFGAPMRLLGFSFEESAALLAKWEKEGVNTQTMLSGLKFGVKTLAGEGVKAADMGEALRAKIDAIGASADPVGESIKTFGLRAGPDLAAAILEGRFATEDLVDVMNNGTDTIAGLSEEVRDVGDVFRILGNRISSVVGPMAAGFGDLASTMGPLLYSLPLLGGAFGKMAAKTTRALGGLARAVAGSAFAHKLGAMVAGAFNALPGSAAIKSAIARVGLVLGSATSLAIAAGMVAVGAAVALAFKAIFLDPALQEQANAIGKSVGEEIAKGTTDALEQSKAALEKGIADINNIPLGGFLYGDQIAELQKSLDATNAELVRRAALVPGAVAAGIDSQAGVVGVAAIDMVMGIPKALKDAKAAAAKLGAGIPKDVAGGIRSRRSEVESAMDLLIEDLANAMSPAKERARVIGHLTGDALAKALRSKDPVVRAQAEQTRAILEGRLAELPVSAKGLGEKTGAKLKEGLKSKDPVVRAQAERTAEIIEAQIRKADTRKAGRVAGANISAGLKDKRNAIGSAAYNIGTLIVRNLLGGITSSGGKKYTGIPGRASGGPVTAGEMYIVGENRRPELFVPDVSGRIIPNLTPATAGGGDTYNITVPMTASPTARDPFAVATNLRRLADFGVLRAKPGMVFDE